jgi:hypothetical protein
MKPLPYRTLGKLIAVLVLTASGLTPDLHANPGDLYTIDETGGPIVRLAPNGTKFQFAPPIGVPSAAMAFDPAGNLYIAAGTNILKFTPNATRTTFTSGLKYPGALVFDAKGNLFVTDDTILYKVTPNGTKSVFATLPHSAPDLAIDRAGNLFVSQGSEPIVKVRPDGTMTTFGVNSAGMFGIAVDGGGNVFTSEFIGGAVYKYSPDGTTRTVFSPAVGYSCGDINFDRAGNLLLNAQGQKSIFKFTPDGRKTVFASGLGFAAWSAWEPARGHSVNLSTRMRVQTGENVLIGGFILAGTEPTTVVIRAIGPSLTNFGIADSLADPVLELRDNSGALIALNDDYRDAPASEIENSGLQPTNTLESAMVRTLPPGTYTTLVKDRTGGNGVGLVEVYDLNGASQSKLVNLSTRGYVEKGGTDVMIGGFIIGADGETVLLRAIGPSLAQAGVIQPLPDPALSLYDSNGSLISSNDDWRSSQEVAILATGIAPSNDRESAILATLVPGAYTAVIQGIAGTVGVGLVEVYNLN